MIGTRIQYDRATLLSMRNSPLSKSPPPADLLAQINAIVAGQPLPPTHTPSSHKLEVSLGFG